MRWDIEELINQFLSNQVSAHTRRAYRCDIMSFLSAFSMDRLAHITADEIAVYRDGLLESLQPSTVARRLTVIRQFLDFCTSAKLLRHNPAQAVRSPKVSQYSSTNGLTREQAESLLRQPDRATVKGKRDYAILCLMLHNGLRNSEVTGIRWRDFYEERGHVVLNIRGKGEKRSITKVKPNVMAAIQDYMWASSRELDAESPLFIGERTNSVVYWDRVGKPLSPGGIRYIVSEYARLAGIGKQITPHSLRHTCVTLCLDGGGTIRHAQYLAQHEDPKTTIRYDRNRHNLDDHGTDYIKLDA